MMLRHSRETLESLRVTLSRLEQTDPASDGKDAAELKQILLNRIAELETLNALSSAEPEPDVAASPADLPPLAAASLPEPDRAMETVSLEKLD